MAKIYTEHNGPMLLRFLTPEDRQLLHANSESYDFNAGEHVIFQRDSEAILYLIEAGRVEVLAGQGVDATRLAVLDAGEVIGEISFLSGARRSPSKTPLSASLSPNASSPCSNKTKSSPPASSTASARSSHSG